MSRGKAKRGDVVLGEDGTVLLILDDKLTVVIEPDGSLHPPGDLSLKKQVWTTIGWPDQTVRQRLLQALLSSEPKITYGVSALVGLDVPA